MLTNRHIERLWNNRKWSQLLDELLAPRIEALAARDLAQNPAASAASLALIRLDELHQAHSPLCSQLIRALISLQETDGGWADVATTTLALRALCLQHGQGLAIDRGMNYLAVLQQPAGIWPKIPIRRMPEDATISAFTLLQLGDNEHFRSAVRFRDAVAWFESNRWMLDANAQTLWDHARLRTSTALPTPALAAAG